MLLRFYLHRICWRLYLFKHAKEFRQDTCQIRTTFSKDLSSVSERYRLSVLELRKLFKGAICKMVGCWVSLPGHQIPILSIRGRPDLALISDSLGMRLINQLSLSSITYNVSVTDNFLYHTWHLISLFWFDFSPVDCIPLGNLSFFWT